MKSPIEVLNDPSLLDPISTILHKQWMGQAKILLETESLSSDLTECWQKYMVDYDHLPDSQKEVYRDSAWKIIQQIAVPFLANSMIPDQYGG